MYSFTKCSNHPDCFIISYFLFLPLPFIGQTGWKKIFVGQMIVHSRCLTEKSFVLIHCIEREIAPENGRHYVDALCQVVKSVRIVKDLLVEQWLISGRKSDVET